MWRTNQISNIASGRIAVIVVAAAALSLGPATCQAADDKKETGDKDGWHSLFDGESLKGWKLADFAGHGDVEVKDGQLLIGVGIDLTGVTLTREFPKMNYEVTLDAMKVDGSDFFCGLTFPVGDAPCTFIAGGWAGTVVGLSSIDGFDASENETTQFMNFEKGRWYRIRLRVTGAKIQTWIDDKKIVDFETKDRKLSIRFEVEPNQPFGIAAWQTTSALKNIKYRLLQNEKPVKESAD